MTSKPSPPGSGLRGNRGTVATVAIGWPLPARAVERRYNPQGHWHAGLRASGETISLNMRFISNGMRFFEIFETTVFWRDRCDACFEVSEFFGSGIVENR